MTDGLNRCPLCEHRLSTAWDSVNGWHYECMHGCDCCIWPHPDPVAAKAQADR